MPYLERDGVRVFYGSHRAGGVLLSYGFGSSSRMWEPNVAALSADRQVVAWDLRGHGRLG